MIETLSSRSRILLINVTLTAATYLIIKIIKLIPQLSTGIVRQYVYVLDSKIYVLYERSSVNFNFIFEKAISISF